MNKIFILVLGAYCLVLSLTTAFAQENLGARPAAMGGAFSGLADDANAIFINPAGIGYLEGGNATISTKISKDKEYTVIGAAETTPFGAFGIGYISSSHPISGVNAAGIVDQGLSPVRELNQSLIVTFARELNDFTIVPKNMGRLAFGANLKISSYRVASAKGLSRDDGSNIDIDLAAVFRTAEDVSLGLNLINFMNGAEGSKVAAGVSGKLLDRSITWSVEGNSVGFEWKPVPLLALRAGRDENCNTAGIGVRVDDFGVDYAYRGGESPVSYAAISVAVDR